MYRKFVVAITILALVLGMVIPIPVSAASDLGYEGRICRDLGILKGDTGVVDSAYLRTKPSRLQAAIMFLRLKGKEQAALTYEGSSNFKDAGDIAWEEGRNVLSYLKNHPELGWIGDGVNFMPYKLIDSRAYYKVLLESLGYKQKNGGIGDFTWEEVLNFAEEKGLDRVADIGSFTVESLAIATVEALQAEIKGSDMKLIEYLVDIGEVDAPTASSLGLYSKEIDAAVKEVKAVSNSKVELVFEGSVATEAADDEDLYDISKLDIKSVDIKNESAVIINTSAMNENTTYTLEFNSRSYSFRGVKKDSYAPRLLEVLCKDSELVELSFDRVLDNRTAQDSSTYEIGGVDIKAAELDNTNTKVRLKTEGIQSGRSYELKIHNMKNGDGITTKLITKRFTGKKDSSAPKLKDLTVLNNVRLRLEFTDSNGLDKSTAEDEGNYRITYSGGSLDVEKAEVKDRDNDGLWETVELVTESQDAGRSYTLEVENICDGSTQANKIAKVAKEKFRGKSVDKKGPEVDRNPNAIGDTMVEIVFEEDNALDLDTVYDMDNYKLDDVELEEIRLKSTDDLYSERGRTVLLITSEMEKSESYTLEISGITDEFGNVMKESTKKYRFHGADDDRTPPYITSVECIDSKTIELNFDNILDETSAENISNYRIDGLALVTKAELQDNEKTVILTVSSLSTDKSHTVLLDGICDISGNDMTNVKVNLYYNGNLNDDDPPEVSDIEAVSKSELWIRFDEEVYATAARMKASGLSFEQVGEVLDEGTTIVMKPLKPMEDEEYTITSLTGVWDLRSNAYDLENDLDFYGSDEENDPPEVDSWEQMDVRRFRVIFNEPVRLIGNGVAGIDNPSGVSIQWTAEVNPDEEDTNDGYSTVDYRASKDIPEDKEFEFNFTEMVADYAGTGAFDEEDEDHGDSGSSILESSMEDDDDPYIEYAEGISRTQVQVVFSEPMRVPGSYKITYEDDDDDLEVIDIDFVEVDSKDQHIVNIFTEDLMSDDYIYTLIPKSAATDIAGNKLDIDDLEIEFAGSSIMSSDYIQGVELLNADTFKVSKSTRIYKVNSLYELDEDGDILGGSLIESTSRISDYVHKVISKKPLLRDVRYKISVDGIEYKFYGGLENGDLLLELPERDITYDGLDGSENYVEVYRSNGDKLDIEEKNDHYEIEEHESLKNGELLYIYVIRRYDELMIYGTRIKIGGMPAASSSKQIWSFSFKDLSPAVEGIIDEEKGTITLTVPYGTELNNMRATYTCSEGAEVRIGSELQFSGKTRNDFNGEVIYTVYAEDGSSRSYTVKAIVKASSENFIKSFRLEEVEALETIITTGSENTISIMVPYGTNIKSLTPIIGLSENAEIVPGSGETLDFSEKAAYTVTAQDGTKRNYTVRVTSAKAMEKLIEEFWFEELDPVCSGRIDQEKSLIAVSVPFGTEVSGLKATFEVSSGVVVSVGGKVQESGETRNDFSSPVKYILEAADGSTREYVVTVTRELNSENQIKSFSFLAPQTAGIIDEAARSIMVKMPYGTDVTKLVAVFENSPESIVRVNDVVQVSGVSVNDFTNTLKYTVTAQDGSTRDYSVTAAVEAQGEKQITGFALLGMEGKTNVKLDQHEHRIYVLVPARTDLTNLVPVFSFVGKAVFVGDIQQQSAVTANDFSGDVIYKVTAEDGSQVEYTVLVKTWGRKE